MPRFFKHGGNINMDTQKGLLAPEFSSWGSVQMWNYLVTIVVIIWVSNDALFFSVIQLRGSQKVYH